VMMLSALAPSATVAGVAMVIIGVTVSVSIAEQLTGAPLGYVRPVPPGPARQVKTKPAGRVTVAVLTALCANSWLDVKSAANAINAPTLPLALMKDRR
jgi:hypothetical protein